MGSKFRIRVSKSNLPPGRILLLDTSILSRGISRTLARLVQMQLGYPAASPLRAEAVSISHLVLKGVSSGSALLECEPLDIPELSGKHPAIISSVQLIDGINHYRETSSWPDYLSAVVRQELGETLKAVLQDEGDIFLEVQEQEGAVWHECKLDADIRDALLQPEFVETDVPVDIVGKVYGIDIDNAKFKVDTRVARVTVNFAPDQVHDIDAVRWSRVFVTGIPEDKEYRRIGSMISIRPATEEEEDGIFPRTAGESQWENAPVYEAVAQKIDVLTQLPDKWDSYNATRPSLLNSDFAIEFFRGVVMSLAAHNIELPEPDVIPTVTGGFQLEWEVGERILELEILAPEEFGFLQIDGDVEREGTVSRWEAMRLIRWVITGEEV